MGDTIQPKLDLSPPRQKRLDPRPEIEIHSPGLAANVEGPKPKPSRKNDRKSRREERKEKKEPKTPEQLARRNVDAYAATRSLGAISTALFLGAGAGAIYTGIKWGGAAGRVAISDQASKGADQFFDSSGELTDAAMKIPFSPLTNLLNQVSEKAQEKNTSVQEVLEDVEKQARQEESRWRKQSVALGIASGAGVVGMFVFFTAAPIIRHRGNILFGIGNPRGKRSRNNASNNPQVQIVPNFGPTGGGAEFMLRF